MATAFLGQPYQLLRSALLACYANGLTGTVAATEDRASHLSPLTSHDHYHLAFLSQDPRL